MPQTKTNTNNGQNRNKNSRRGGWAKEPPTAVAAAITVTIVETSRLQSIHSKKK